MRLHCRECGSSKLTPVRETELSWSFQCLSCGEFHQYENTVFETETQEIDFTHRKLMSEHRKNK